MFTALNSIRMRYESSVRKPRRDKQPMFDAFDFQATPTNGRNLRETEWETLCSLCRLNYNCFRLFYINVICITPVRYYNLQ